MPQNKFISDVINKFFFKEKLTHTEQYYLKELMPQSEEDEALSVDKHTEMYNEIASFYTGEYAQYVKQYLLLNDLLAKDHARIIREELSLFRKFFSFLSHELENNQTPVDTLKRLEYVIVKIDTYLKKYSAYS